MNGRYTFKTNGASAYASNRRNNSIATGIRASAYTLSAYGKRYYGYCEQQQQPANKIVKLCRTVQGYNFNDEDTFFVFNRGIWLITYPPSNVRTRYTGFKCKP